MGADLSPAARIRHAARYSAASTALIYEDAPVSYGEFYDRVLATATGLARSGLRRGDRVAYLGLNSATLLEAFFAAACLGAVFVPVNSRLAAPEAAHVLRDSGAHTLLAEEGHRALVEAVAPEIPVRRLLLVDTDPAAPATGEPAPCWDRLSTVARRDGAGTVEPLALTEDDIAVLMYTSGSTGLPKGVVLTHGNLWWNTVNVDALLDTRRGDTTLAVAPMFHIGGLNAFTLGTLIRGGTAVVRRGFEPGQCLEDLLRHRRAGLFAVPAMYSALARTPGFAEADLSFLRAAVVAGAPVPAELIHSYADHGVLLQQAWGLTETSPFATYLPSAATREKAGSAGIPMPFTEIRLIDPRSGHLVDEPLTRGEICVRGPNVTPGYWNDPAATREALREGGWLHTGDIGQLDGDGYLYVVDHAKDMIITGGENVYPAEVERALTGCPGIADIAVVGTPHPRWGETVVAVVVPEGGAAPGLQEVRDHAEQQLARYKLPSALLLTDALPRNGSGKTDKPALRRWAAERTGRANP